ncbi:MAG: ferredoxin [Gammaproteobacteria bacterium]|nr:MAG: ferredoxin [Gammaproteobacteria bacterium]
MVINPDECIDCSLCVPACPADAIYPDDELPEGQEVFIQINAELCQQWPNIDQVKAPPADAQSWNGKTDKLALLERE